jgi:hypothetical protein
MNSDLNSHIPQVRLKESPSNSHNLHGEGHKNPNSFRRRQGNIRDYSNEFAL